MTRRPVRPTPPRRSLFDGLSPDINIYCRLSDLSNEASVETFFLARMLEDLGFQDAQIKTKESIEKLTISRGGRKRERWKPDYVLFSKKLPRVVVDAKSTNEDPEDWAYQTAGYALALNQKYKTSNPVRYYVISNGKSTLIYEWDNAQPILELAFSDFQWENAKYEQLKETIGAKNVISSSPGRGLSETTTDLRHRETLQFVRPTPERAKQLFAQCHRALWKAEGMNPPAAFMPFVKVMFVKLWCDKRLRSDPAVSHLFTADDQSINLLTSSIVFSTQWIEAREADGAVNPIDSILFDRLREEIERGIQEKKKKRIFNKNEHIGLNPDTVKDVVRRLQHFDMFGIDEDLNGRLFETFLSATMRGRELGQFFTPRSVVKMMSRVAAPRATLKHQDKVIDACCGSGGFLIEGLTLMRNQIRANRSLSMKQKNRLIQAVSNSCLFGIDFGKDPPLARIARINMYLHGDGGSRIYLADALDKNLATPEHGDLEENQNVKELRGELSKPLLFDFALTNPPFSMTKEVKNQGERRILEQYVLARKSGRTSAIRPSLRSSLMFIERYHDLLRPGGQLITVIDDTLLASTKFYYVREFIREHFIIRGIISLPGDTFRRQGSRVKTSVLILEKKHDPDDEQPACFAYFAEHLGVDDLTPRASLAAIEKARAKAETETTNILDEYVRFVDGKPVTTLLAPDRLQDRLDLKFCVPQFGRMATKWKAANIPVQKLAKCVLLVEDEIRPKDEPEREYDLLKVSYEGRCEVAEIRKGKAINPRTMYRVRKGHLVFSTIRATDGAIGVVPLEYDGALVSTSSYAVFDAGSDTDAAYLWGILRSSELRADMQSLSPGSGRYTTRWPDVGEVLIPWPEEDERRKKGRAFLKTWDLERQVKESMTAAQAEIDEFEIESEESKRRFRLSKAPT